MQRASAKRVLVYGCNGYTARLLLPRLRALGIDVIAAGRNRAAVSSACEELGFEPRVFDLIDPERVDDALADVAVVLNAAGPFRHTAPALIDACLRQRVDYLDLSGELDTLAYAARCGPFAQSLGLMLLPAVGFDVVPTDCLAVHLLGRLPTATHLTMSLAPSNLLSRGSAVTLAEMAGPSVQSRRDGVLEPMRMRMQMRWVDFGGVVRPTVAVTWGDLVTAFHSTRIPNIEVYFEATAFRLFTVTLNQFWGWAIEGPSRAWLEAAARMTPDGPTSAERVDERSVIVCEVSDGRKTVRARLVTPEAYDFTAESAALALVEVLGGTRRAGFTTPGSLFGPDFVLRVPGVTRESLS